MHKHASLNVHHRTVDFPEQALVTGFNYTQPDARINFLHQHQYVEIGYCHRGEGIFIVDQQVMPFSAGDVVVIPADKAHLAQSAIGSSSDWTFCYVDETQLRLQLGNLGRSSLLALQHLAHFKPQQSPALTSTALLLSQQLVEPADMRGDVLSGFILALLGLIAGQIEPDKPMPPITAASKKIEPAIAFLAGNFTQAFSVDELAQRCGLSSAHFRRLFHQCLGVSPRGYLFKLRIEMAKVMLRERQDSVLDISMAVGFVTLSSFNRQFKGLVGVSPRQWRAGE